MRLRLGNEAVHLCGDVEPRLFDDVLAITRRALKESVRSAGAVGSGTRVPPEVSLSESAHTWAGSSAARASRAARAGSP